MEDIVTIISNVGFPIAIATYIIIVMNKTLTESNELLTRLVEKLDSMEQTLNAKNT